LRFERGKEGKKGGYWGRALKSLFFDCFFCWSRVFVFFSLGKQGQANPFFSSKKTGKNKATKAIKKKVMPKQKTGRSSSKQ